MIVLFIVVLVSIVGTAMLSTTTYALKNVQDSKLEQQEFYRAEGALEIVMTQMENYKNDNESGPLAYLQEEPRTSVYNIGGKEIKVEITIEPKDISTIPSNILVTLKAQYSGAQSKVSRNLEFTIINSAVKLGRTVNKYNLWNIDEFTKTVGNDDKGDYDPNILGEISEEDYKDIVDSLDKLPVATPSGTIDGNYYIFPKGVTKVNSISLSGNKEKIKIPADSIVYVKELNLQGSGNSTQVIVDGALIVDKLIHTAKSELIINSGIIVKEAIAQSRNFKIEGNPQGISCDLLEAACTKINDSVTSSEYSSIIDSNSNTIKFSTER